MPKTLLTPGELARKSGIYWVYHYAHRPFHPAEVKKGMTLPSCRVCGERVRFEPANSIPQPPSWPIFLYEDFRAHDRRKSRRKVNKQAA